MSRTLSLSAAQPKLAELVAGMVPGEELVLTANEERIAIVTPSPRTSWPCQPGTAKDRSFGWPRTSTLRWMISRSPWNDAPARHA